MIGLNVCLEQRSIVHFLLLDFVKAFDSVPHERLLLKLSSLGIHGKVLSWLKLFLTKRKQRVVLFQIGPLLLLEFHRELSWVRFCF